MKVNLAVYLKDLAGNDVIDARGEKIMLSKFLANGIISEEAKDKPMEKFELADKLYNASGEVDIKESEKETIKKFCESGKITVLIAAQILVIINNAK